MGDVVPDSNDLRVPAPAARAPEDVAGRVAEGRQILNPYAFEDL